jgi:hypothetical protein
LEPESIEYKVIEGRKPGHTQRFSYDDNIMGLERPLAHFSRLTGSVLVLQQDCFQAGNFSFMESKSSLKLLVALLHAGEGKQDTVLRIFVTGHDTAAQ